MALCLVGIHAYFGLQVLARRVIFVDLALAQVAALGATVGFMLGHPAAGACDLRLFARLRARRRALLAATRAWSARVPQEALIGVVYVVAAAASILLIDRAPQGAEHLKQILTGNILTSGTDELAAIVPLYAAVGARALAAAPPSRRRRPASLWEFVFYATFGIVVTSSVAHRRRAAGVLVPDHPGRDRRDLRRRRPAASLRSAGPPGRSRAPPGSASPSPSTCRPAPPWCAPSAPRWRSPGLLSTACGAGRAQAVRRGIVALRWYRGRDLRRVRGELRGRRRAPTSR